MNNQLRTTVLIAAMTALFMAVGFLIGGPTGMLVALVVAAATNLFAYWNSDKMVLSMYGAREVDAASAPDLYGLVATLAQRGGLPMPRVYIMDTEQPNAFATGRDPEHAAVAITTGLLNMLTREEVAGVLAHELAHVRNRDTLTMTITATIAGAIGMLANFAFLFTPRSAENNRGPFGAILGLLALIIAPFAAMLVQMAISRAREYEADRGGAEISGDPMALAGALAKIEAIARGVPNPAAQHNPATAHMFIVNPLSGGTGDSLFATHPATENRIAELEALARLGVGQVPPSARTAPAGPWRQVRRGPWG